MRLLVLSVLVLGRVAGGWAQVPTPTAIGQVTPPLMPTEIPLPTPTGTPRPIAVGLSLRASSPIVVEGSAVSVVGTLSRPIPNPATVRISSNELSQAGVFESSSTDRLGRLRFPSQIEIAPNQTRFSFLVYAVEDDFFWSLPRLRFSVSYSAFGSGPLAETSALLPLAVRDNDRPRVLLRLNGSSWRQGSSDPRRLWVASNVRPLGVTISLSSSDPALSLGASTVQEGSYLQNFVPTAVSLLAASPATCAATIFARAPGCDPASAQVSLVGADAPALRLSLQPPSVDEDNPAGTLALVSREGDLSQPLRVSARVDDARVARASSASVVMARGQSSASFRVIPRFAREPETDQREMLGERDVVPVRRPLKAQVSVEAAGLASSRATLSVRDATPTIEAVATPDFFVEGLAPTTGVLSLRLLRPRFFDVRVSLTSSNRRVVFSNPNPLVPRSGATLRVPFVIRNDTESTFEYVQINVRDEFSRPSNDAAPFGLVTGVSILIQDDESPLSLRLLPRLVSNQKSGFVLLVSRGRAASTSLRVVLSTSWSEAEDRIVLPAQVVIPAGQREVSVRGSFAAADSYGDLRIQAQTAGGATAFAYLRSEFYSPRLVLLSVDSLSPSEPRGLAVLRVGGLFSEYLAPMTRLHVSTDSPALAVPTSVVLQPGQQYLLLPFSLRPGAAPATGVARLRLSPASISDANGRGLNEIPISYEIPATFSPARLSTAAIEPAAPEEGIGTRVRLKFTLPLLRASVLSESGLFLGRVTFPQRGTQAQASGVLEDGGRTLVLAFDESVRSGEPIQITLAARDGQNRSLELRQLLLFAP